MTEHVSVKESVEGLMYRLTVDMGIGSGLVDVDPLAGAEV